MSRTSRGLAALVLAALAFASAHPARAAIETDPQALYDTMRRAYDDGTAKKWPFASERYYQSTIFDAGRAYALFRPSDAAYAEVARLAVDVATQLHYDPLTNDDAALWYVLEAANLVAKNGDPEHQAEATALLQRLDATGGDPAAVARQAEADALADVAAFRRDPDALVELLVTDVRAYDLTGDPAYRSALLQHAAASDAPLIRVPDPAYARMLGLAHDALADPGFSDADRVAARAIDERRKREPELQVIARVSAIPHELKLTRTAPADEYFGNLKFSPIGVRNEVVRIGKYLDKGWGTRMESDALQVDSSVEDWQKQYPHDYTLPATLLDAYRLLLRVSTPKTQDAATRVKALLVVQYPSSRQAREIAAS